MLKKMYKTELEYVKHFAESYESKNYIKFSDDNLPGMYTHNFIFIKDNYGKDKIREIILNEIEIRKEKGFNFLRVEFNFSFDNTLLDKLPFKATITKYDYMYIDPREDIKLNINKEATVKKAKSESILNEGIKVDILANKSSMGKDFAQKRINRKADIYRNKNNNLNLYVCYYKKTPVGNCEFMYHNQTAKLEDFDILEKFQRRGLGTTVIEYLLNETRENGVNLVYLITETNDTAKEMYKKCGFKKAGEKVELFFDLN